VEAGESKPPEVDEGVAEEFAATVADEFAAAVADADGDGVVAKLASSAGEAGAEGEGVTADESDAEAETDADGDGEGVGEGVRVGEFEDDVPGEMEAADETEAVDVALAEGPGMAALAPGGTTPLAARFRL